jgi:putative addiction module killer protein
VKPYAAQILLINLASSPRGMILGSYKKKSNLMPGYIFKLVNHRLHFNHAPNPPHSRFRHMAGCIARQSRAKTGVGQAGPLVIGHWGDCKPVGGDVVELRVHSGPGYRVYCWKDGLTVVVAMGGGDKSSQERDITKAQHTVTVLKE